VGGYFLDTSALAKLYHREDGSQYVEWLVGVRGSSTIISRLSLVEMESVLAIKVRTGELDAGGREGSRSFNATFPRTGTMCDSTWIDSPDRRTERCRHPACREQETPKEIGPEFYCRRRDPDQTPSVPVPRSPSRRPRLASFPSPSVEAESNLQGVKWAVSEGLL
jgi:hypothetical protein